MSTRRPRTPASSEDERVTLGRLLERPLFELIPLRDALERAESLPPGAVTTVTASPTHGIESTIELCEGLIARGHPATPHLAAHMIRDRAHLAELLERCRRPGSETRSWSGGDAKDRGEIHDGLALLRLMEELGHPFEAVGVAGYPEGHPSIPEEILLSSLREKQGYASYLTTQMSFDRDRDRIVDRADPERGRDAARPPRAPGSRGHAEVGSGGSPDRRRWLAPVPGEESAAPPSPLPPLVHSRATAPLARSHARRSGGGRARPPSLHVQPGGGDGHVAASGCWPGSR